VDITGVLAEVEQVQLAQIGSMQMQIQVQVARAFNIPSVVLQRITQAVVVVDLGINVEDQAV
jgi:hypothetical protein